MTIAKKIIFTFWKALDRGDKRSVSVKKNIVGSFLVKGASIIISLMLVPMTLGYVSSELYGIWLTLSSIMMMLNFFDIGFTLGLKNKLAEAIAVKDWKRGKSLVSTTYFMMVLIFLPLCLLLEVILPYVNWASFLNVDAIYNIEITKALHVLVACFCLQMIVNVLVAVVAAYQKVALSSVFPVIGNFLSLIAIYILTKTCDPSLIALSLAVSIMPVIAIFISSLFLFSKVFKDVSPSIKYVNRKYIKDLFGLGAKFFIIQIQVVILYQATNILMSNVAGPNEVTSYNIAYKYLGVAMMAYSIILTPLWPAFTDAYIKRDFVWMRMIYKKMVRIFMLSVLILLGMIACSQFVYHLWIGEKATVSFAMTLVVGIYMIIHAWDSLQVSLINGIGAVKLQTYITIIGLVLHIPLSLLLGKYIGALGIVSSMVIINIIYLCFFTKQINLILKEKAKGIWIK